MAVVTITLADDGGNGVTIKVLSEPPIPVNLEDYSDAQYFASEMVNVVVTPLNLQAAPASGTVN